MERNNKQDNLERFFQQSLQGFEEDPGADFWDRIVPIIPDRPIISSNSVFYKGWMLFLSFGLGVLATSLYFHWQLNNERLIYAEQLIQQNQQSIEAIRKKLKTETVKLPKAESLTPNPKNQEKKQLSLSKKTIFTSKESPGSNFESALKNQKNDLVIKPVIARQKSVVAPIADASNGTLQPFYLFEKKNHLSIFETTGKAPVLKTGEQLLFDNQLITNTFFNKQLVTNQQLNGEKIEMVGFNPIPSEKNFEIIATEDFGKLSRSDKRILEQFSNLNPIEKANQGELRTFLVMSFNSLVSKNYKFEGYRDNVPISHRATTKLVRNWSINAGIENRKNWIFQLGLDYNNLKLVKKSTINVRYHFSASDPTIGGYIQSFNRKYDSALGPVSIISTIFHKAKSDKHSLLNDAETTTIVNQMEHEKQGSLDGAEPSTIFNQIENDGQDLLDGAQIKLTATTEQPLKFVRLPILSGYKLHLGSRWQITPKAGFAVTWGIKEKVKLQGVETSHKRLVVRNEEILITNTFTQRYLEGLFRTEFAYRWRPAWYIIAEPQLKIGNKALFTYNSVGLEERPWQLFLGLRFNIE